MGRVASARAHGDSCLDLVTDELCGAFYWFVAMEFEADELLSAILVIVAASEPEAPWRASRCPT